MFLNTELNKLVMNIRCLAKWLRSMMREKVDIDYLQSLQEKATKEKVVTPEMRMVEMPSQN